MVPSFLPPTLILPKAEGRLPRDRLFGGAIEEQLHRLAAALLRETRADFGPRRPAAELAAETAAHVIHLDVDIGGGHFQVRAPACRPMPETYCVEGQ